MKELLERFGLSEFLVYLCPGVIVLFSSTLWMTPDLSQILGGKMADQQLIVGVLLFILAYALGLIIAWSGNEGSDLYIRFGVKRLRWKESNPGKSRLLALVVWLLTPFFWLPQPGKNQSIVEGRAKMAEGLTSYSGMLIFLSRWDMPRAYRTVISGIVAEAGRPILNEAESVHTRTLFALGVGMAALIVAVQALARLIIGLVYHCSLTLPAISLPLMLVIFTVGLGVSFGLRIVAGKWWEYELLLTSGLTR